MTPFVDGAPDIKARGILITYSHFLSFSHLALTAHVALSNITQNSQIVSLRTHTASNLWKA